MKRIIISLLLCTIMSHHMQAVDGQAPATSDADDIFFAELLRISEEPETPEDDTINALVNAVAAEKVSAAQSSFFTRHCVPYLITLMLYYKHCKEYVVDCFSTFFADAAETG